jgi:hypothetical protein
VWLSLFVQLLKPGSIACKKLCNHGRNTQNRVYLLTTSKFNSFLLFIKIKTHFFSDVFLAPPPGRFHRLFLLPFHRLFSGAFGFGSMGVGRLCLGGMWAGGRAVK